MNNEIKANILEFIGLLLCFSNPFTPIIGIYLFKKGLDYEGSEKE